MARLSPRELQIIQGIAEGKTKGQIAAELFVSPATVKTHIERAYLKLGARNAAHAVAIAYQAGALKVEDNANG